MSLQRDPNSADAPIALKIPESFGDRNTSLQADSQ
jgi:hypothetical protein